MQGVCGGPYRLKPERLCLSGLSSTASLRCSRPFPLSLSCPHTLRLLPSNLPFVGRGLDPSAAPCPYLTPYLFHLPVGAGHARPARFRKLLYQLRQPVLPPTTPATSASARAVRWTRGPGFSIPARVTFYARHLLKSAYKEKSTTSNEVVLFGDPCGNRTHVNGVRGRCLNRLTNGP